MRRSGISAILVVGLLGGSTIAVTAQEAASHEDPSATSVPIEELAFPSIPPSGSGPSTFSWDAEQWDYTRDPETGRELRVLRIEATEPRAAGWAFTLDDRWDHSRARPTPASSGRWPICPMTAGRGRARGVVSRATACEASSPSVGDDDDDRSHCDGGRTVGPDRRGEYEHRYCPVRAE